MVGARSAAMTMNRIADLEFDRRNPRTANRALPKGELSVGFAWAFTVIASAVLVFAAWQLNPLALKLSPVALAVLFFYSYTKRFTAWSHFVLGFCSGHFARRRMDRHSRLARPAHADPLRRRHALGRRLRRALRLPGRRIRQDRRPLFHPKKIRHCPRPPDRPRHALDNGRACSFGWPSVFISPGRPGWESSW